MNCFAVQYSRRAVCHEIVAEAYSALLLSKGETVPQFSVSAYDVLKLRLRPRSSPLRKCSSTRLYLRPPCIVVGASSAPSYAKSEEALISCIILCQSDKAQFGLCILRVHSGLLYSGFSERNCDARCCLRKIGG